MQETDAWLDKVMLPLPRFEDMEDDEEFPQEWYSDVKKQIKDRILESYKNGQKAALRSAATSWPAEDSKEKDGKGTKKPWFNRRKSRNG